jgi:hypothetical protein
VTTGCGDLVRVCVRTDQAFIERSFSQGKEWDAISDER